MKPQFKIGKTQDGYVILYKAKKGFWIFKKTVWKPYITYYGLEKAFTYKSRKGLELSLASEILKGGQDVCCDFTECTTVWRPTWTNPFNTVTNCVEGDTCHPIDCNEIEQ